ncbi:MAG TPA: hypothetical protein VFV50_12335, partial [Bdellovibrionales bacterium]|nr:hypothetical protein [Bdellovibrionales bacterium]
MQPFIRTLTLTVLMAMSLAQPARATFRPFFHSPAGDESVVTFNHIIETEFRSLEELARLSAAERDNYMRYRVKPLLKFVFGPS